MRAATGHSIRMAKMKVTVTAQGVEQLRHAEGSEGGRYAEHPERAAAPGVDLDGVPFDELDSWDHEEVDGEDIWGEEGEGLEIEVDPDKLFAPEDDWGRRRGPEGLTPEQLADRRALWDTRLSQVERDRAAMRHLRRTLSDRINAANLTPEQTEAAIGDAVLEAMKQLRSAEMKAWRSENPKAADSEFAWSPMALHRLVADNMGLVNQCFAPAAQKVRFDPKVYSAQDVKARSLLAKAEEEFRVQHERDMTRGERAAEAQRIHMTFPSGRRPHIGWEDFDPHENSIHEQDESGSYVADRILRSEDRDPLEGELRSDEEIAAAADAEIARREQAGPLSAEERQRIRIEMAGPADQKQEWALSREQRKSAWSTYAEATGLPRVRQAPMKRESAKRARGIVASYEGGVAKLADDLAEGRIPVARRDAYRAALLAPFASNPNLVSDPDAYAILDTLVSNRAHADRLWGSALDEATR